MTIRTKFVERFGENEALAIEAAAREHKNGVHDNPGSDHFKWAIAIAIGFECMSRDAFREYHEINTPWDELKQWIKDEADLNSHDGDVDYLALVCGAYDEFIPKETLQ